MSAHEAESTPTFAVLDRLEKESRLITVATHEFGEGRDGSLEIGENLDPDRHDRVLGGEGDEFVERWTHDERGRTHGAPKAVKKHVRAPV